MPSYVDSLGLGLEDQARPPPHLRTLKPHVPPRGSELTGTGIADPSYLPPHLRLTPRPDTSASQAAPGDSGQRGSLVLDELGTQPRMNGRGTREVTAETGSNMPHVSAVDGSAPSAPQPSQSANATAPLLLIPVPTDPNRTGQEGSGKAAWHQCSFEGCDSRFKTKKELKTHKKKVHDYCRLCDIDFANWDEYHAHKVESREHIVCPICSVDFRTQDGRNTHLRQNHPKGQDLRCPGCHCHYARAAALMYHMENNHCHTVTREQFMKARMVNAIVHGAFEEKDSHGDAADPAPELNEEHFPSLGAPSRAGASRSAGPEAFAAGFEANASEMGARGMPEENATTGAGKRDLTDMGPEDVNRIQNLAKKILGGRSGLRRKHRADGSPHDDIYLDPLSPFFEASLFQNKYGRLDCPYVDCSETAANPAMLNAHCRSHAHQEAVLTCPQCVRRFGSISAFVGHLESSGVRCRIQRTGYFEDSLAIATGGFVVCTGFHDDGSVRLKEEEPLYVKSLAKERS